MNYYHWIATLTLISIYSLTASATDQATATIIQIINTEKLVVSEPSDEASINSGDILLATFKNNTQCPLIAKHQQDKFWILSSENCPSRDLLEKNQSLEKALSIQATPTKIAEQPTSLANEKNSYWSIGIGLLSSPKMEKDFTVFAGTNSVRGSAELDFDSAFSVNLKWSQNYKQKWNHGINLSYSQVDLKNAKLEIGNSSTSGKAEGELNILTISYAGSLRFTDFYIPTYIGSSSGKFKSNDEFIETITTRVFLAGGVGFIINEHFHVEGTFNFHSTYSPGKTLDTGSGSLRFIPDVGSLSYLHLVAKFVF